MIATNPDKDHTLAEYFFSQTMAEFTLAFDPEGEVARRYALKGMASSFIIDKQGRILKTGDATNLRPHGSWLG